MTNLIIAIAIACCVQQAACDGCHPTALPPVMLDAAADAVPPVTSDAAGDAGNAHDAASPTPDAGQPADAAPTTDAQPTPGGGSLVVRMSTGSGRSPNCASAASGGGGITTSALSASVDGSCATISLTRSTSGEIYETSCGPAPDVACMDDGDTLTATNIQPGAYFMNGIGRIDGTSCWSGVASVTVRAAATSSVRINLTLLDRPGCPRPR